MEFFKNAFGALAFVVSIIAGSLRAQSVDYQWSNLKIGGGGYVTGMVVHPRDKNIKYIRTDVGGAYKWDIKESKWIQMLDFLGTTERNLIGVDGIALDPNKPNRVYMALGRYVHQEGGVYRSEDQGNSWIRLLAANYESNSSVARWMGECIAVDPNSSSVIYAGTRRQGLWKSVDDGKNWSKVIDIPDDTVQKPPAGIRSVVFDSGRRSKGRSSDVFVGMPGRGIYFSSDGGETFSVLKGAPVNPARMQVVNHRLYVTHDSGVSVWSAKRWQNITPQPDRKYVGLAVDERDSKKVIVAQWKEGFNNPMYRSRDGGSHWEQIHTKAVPAVLHTPVPWWPKAWFSSATSSLTLAEGGSGEMYHTDWFATWQTPDIWADSINWHTQVSGHEETVVLTLAAPHSGALVYSGMADVFGFRHDNTSDYPGKRLHPLNECFSIAICENAPSHIAVLGAKTWGGDQTQLWTSADRGENWIQRKLPEGAKLGKIAVSPVNPSMMVYVSGIGDTFFTTDLGKTWSSAKNAPKNILKARNIWDKYSPLTADMVNECFYLFKDGILYSSANGADWAAKTSMAIPAADRPLAVAPIPGQKGALWVCLYKNGLWRTNDAGKTFVKVAGIDTASAFAWGAPAIAGGVPTAYCYGTIEDKWGIYRSLDMGKSWLRINDDKHQFPAGVQALAGDRNIFGQVYIGTGGLGIVYGKEIDSDNK